MHLPSLVTLSLCCALAASAQSSTSTPIVIPAAKTDAVITLLLPVVPPKDAKIRVLPLVDSKGGDLSSQPSISDVTFASAAVSLHLSQIYFWGDAKLLVQVYPGPLYTYTLRRGPFLASNDVSVEEGIPSQLWLYNFEGQPVQARWRIVSGVEAVCGVDANWQPRRDCSSVSRWSETTLGPARSDAIEFVLPVWLFNPWKICGDDVRQAMLELRFGTAGDAPLFRTKLKLHLDHGPGLWLNAWLPSASAGALNLLTVTFWITLGAVLLMLAQVMLPNFRKCLRMEGQLESLQERLRAIGTGVGTRLYTRCDQELSSVRVGLAMNQTDTKPKFRAWDRWALSGNSAEVARLESVLPKIESRIFLTEQLNERQAAAIDSGVMPPSFCWNRVKELLNVQEILSRQFVTDLDEKSATAALDRLADDAASLKDFAADLETRIAGLRRQFDAEPWKSSQTQILTGFKDCAELLKSAPPADPNVAWTIDELVTRDLAAVRLEIIHQMIALGVMVDATTQAALLKKLQSTDPVTLNDARVDLLKLAQGVSVSDIEQALTSGKWDAFYEPATVTDQDVLRCSFIFRNRDYNRRAARDSFQCSWQVCTKDTDGNEEENWENGWEIQFIPRRGSVKVTPVVQDSNGIEIEIRKSKKDQGVDEFDVGPPRSNTWRSRLLRGLLDASLTAMVPVITVIVTQLNTNASLPIKDLVLLGFTSQAIRAAVIPDPIAATPPAKTAAPTTSG